MGNEGGGFGKRLVRPPGPQQVPPEGKEKPKAPEALQNQRTQNFKNLRRIQRSNPDLKEVLDEWRNLAIRGDSEKRDVLRRARVLEQINGFLPENQRFAADTDLPLTESDLPPEELGA
jgi:hypothetical protein